MSELASADDRRPVVDMPRFDFFRLRGVPRGLSSESQTVMQVTSVTSSNVYRGREAEYFGATASLLYNLQYKDYINNLLNNKI
jgi:hypothetical protein